VREGRKKKEAERIFNYIKYKKKCAKKKGGGGG